MPRGCGPASVRRHTRGGDQLLGVRQPPVEGGGLAHPLHDTARAEPGGRSRDPVAVAAHHQVERGGRPAEPAQQVRHLDGGPGQHEEDHPAGRGPEHRAERQFHALHTGQREAAGVLRDVDRVEGASGGEEDRRMGLPLPHPAHRGTAPAGLADPARSGRVRPGSRAGGVTAGTARTTAAGDAGSPEGGGVLDEPGTGQHVPVPLLRVPDGGVEELAGVPPRGCDGVFHGVFHDLHNCTALRGLRAVTSRPRGSCRAHGSTGGGARWGRSGIRVVTLGCVSMHPSVNYVVCGAFEWRVPGRDLREGILRSRKRQL